MDSSRWSYKVYCMPPSAIQNSLPTPVTSPTISSPGRSSMLATSLPRPKHTHQHHNASISLPMTRNSDLPSPTFMDRASSQRSHKVKSPSISTPMHWLTRQSSKSSSIKSTPTISEPKLVHENGSQRGGTLGTGAIVVRTPDEALKDSGVRLDYDGLERTTPPSGSPLKKAETPLPPIPHEEEEDYTSELSHVAELPEDVEASEEDGFQEGTLEGLAIRPPAPSPAPTHLIPEPPQYSRTSSHSSLKLQLDDHSPFPSMPVNAHVPPSANQPNFDAILLSEVPGPDVDRSKIIVALETCTETYRTTYITLASRKSYLGDYLTSLIPSKRSRQPSNASSVYSTASAAEDASAYKQHLTSQGLASEAAYIHIFIDRPSKPYVCSRYLAH